MKHTNHHWRKLFSIAVATFWISGCCGSSQTSQDEPKSPPKSSAKKSSAKKSSTKKPSKKETTRKPSQTNLQTTTPFPWPSDAKAPKRPKACKTSAKPTQAHLGLKPDAFMTCLQGLLRKAKLPKEARASFQKKVQANGTQTYDIKDYMSVVITPHTSGSIQNMDVFFFNKLRKKHGFTPELEAQFATMAALFPSTHASTARGKALFESIDKRGRASNNHKIISHWDGVTLESSFLPVSVRYRFSASKP